MSNNNSEYTFRAILVGCLIGGIVCCMNIYIGLRIGWSFGSSIISSILGYAIFQIINPRNHYSKLENNITQTTGSAASSMASAAGLLAMIPALQLMNIEMPIWALFLWSLSVAYLGVMFAVPLRKQYIEIENLRFPSALATINTMNSLYASSAEALKKAKYLLIFAVIGFVYILIAHKIPELEDPNLHLVFDYPILTILATWGVTLTISPSLFSAGFLIGPRVGISLLLGSIVGWSLGYYAQQQGWAPHENPLRLFDDETGVWGARGWILWTGVSIMVSESLMSLALSYKTLIKAFSGLGTIISKKQSTTKSNEIPNSWWITGLVLASLLTISITYFLFAIPPYLSILAIILSFLLSNVSIRAVGETDINPISGVAKVSQVVFGTISDSITSNLIAGGITGGGASQAGDMMQDFKTGNEFGASPKHQFKAQLWGILSGVFFAVGAYSLFTLNWEIGGKELPAPSAFAWKAVASVMSKGLNVLPPLTGTGVLIGALFGASLSILYKYGNNIKNYIPSGLAFGISFIITANYSIIMFLGALGYIIWNKTHPKSCKELVYPIACGILVGEGIGAIVKALWQYLETA